MEITVSIDSEQIESIVENVLNDGSYMNHSGVQDTIEEWLKDNDYVQGDTVEQAVKNALSNYSFVEDNDLESAVSRAGFVTEDEVRTLISDEATDVLDEGDVERIVDDKLDALDLDDVVEIPGKVTELERRFDVYAQHVDQDRSEIHDLATQANDLDNRVGALGTNHEDLLQFQKAQVSQITALEQRLDAALNDDHERRIQTLEERTQQAVVEGLLGRIEELERKLEASVIVDGSVIDMLVKRTGVLESQVMKLVQAQAAPVTTSDKAGLFYSLVKQAFDLLRS